MRFKLDETLGTRGRDLISGAGHDVATVPEQSLTSALDEKIFEVCAAEDRALVTLDLDFAPDGSLSGPPQVANISADPLFQIAAESARRAAIGCQPYNLPVEDYDQWQSVRFNFDPREMLGG